MRILTWNVNVLRTTLDYHPWSSMKNKTVEGLLEELGADIACFQEHKTRRQQVTKAMACPGPYDAFWTWPRSKAGYSGVCTYVDSRVAVPLRAEEGITGLLLSEAGGAMRPPWVEVEKIGNFADLGDLELEPNENGEFDPRSLDVEGRAVVLDFGMFVLFNLYCPNETNEARRPYKLNFLRVLEARVAKLMAAGREVIVAGDMNVMRAPLDSGEGGIKSTAEQHYEHPARRWFDSWCAPRGPMVDVVRESWPEREGMFTCWNTKIDARAANYGSRIDYILCTPGLRPWIKGGDIQPQLYGSDHCPVYLDLHDSITLDDGKTLHLCDLLNPPDRPPSTAPVYPSHIPRAAPEPPRMATKFLDEFSAKQRTLMSLWGKKPSTASISSGSGSASPAPEENEGSQTASQAVEDSTTLGTARAAFSTLDKTGLGSALPPTPVAPSSIPAKRPVTVDLTADDEEPPKKVEKVENIERKETKGKAKAPPKPAPKAPKSKDGQATLAAFWTSKAKPEVASPKAASPKAEEPSPMEIEDPDTEADAALARALAAADAEEDAARQRARSEKQEQAAPVWSSLFARKLPPLCTMHQKPCKDFIVKIQGPNKGKRFWLCSLPVGPGYDTGRSRRPREEVDRQYRCDFFLWDSANSRKETPNVKKEETS